MNTRNALDEMTINSEVGICSASAVEKDDLCLKAGVVSP